MRINPINVINLLLAYFQTLEIPDSVTNHKDFQLAEKIQQILLDANDKFSEVEMIVEKSLNFHEEYKDHDARIVKDEIQHHFPDPIQAPTNECTEDNEEVDFDYKQKAVEFCRSGKKKNLNIETVKNRFKKVISISQLKRWAHTINKGGTYRDKVARICQYTLDNFKTGVERGLIIHDRDIRRWALRAKKEIASKDFRFKALRSWLSRFKQAHRIVSRKINKFITRKTLESNLDLHTKADAFVADVKSCVPTIGIQNLHNSDQSGFQLEMHYGRTLLYFLRVI